MNPVIGEGKEPLLTDTVTKYSFLRGRLRCGPDPTNEGKTISAGDYSNGKPHFRYPMENGKIHGECLSWYPNGNIAGREFYSDGKLQGLCRRWHSNGVELSAGVWLDGLREGRHRQWYDRGSIHIHENFIKGLLQGARREWYANGSIKAETFYRQGIKDGLDKKWYENGVLKRQSRFSLGIPTGQETCWHSNGTVKSRMSYSRGRLNGAKTMWAESGKTVLLSSFVQGRRHGRERKWDPEGNLISDQFYVQGALLDNSIGDLIKTNKLTVEYILKMRNAAVRRICLEMFGYARFLSSVPHEIIDKDGENELVRINWHRREEPICLVKVKCPSTGAFYTLRVPPAIKTAREGVAWTFGVKEKEYKPESET